MHFISTLFSAAFRRHQLCSLLGCLLVIACLSACKPEPKALSEAERMQILAEASTVLAEAKSTLRYAIQNRLAEELHKSSRLFTEAVDLFLRVEVYDSAYDAALNEIATFVMVGRHERGMLAFEKISAYPVDDMNPSKVKVYLNAAPCYSEAFYPGQANQLMDSLAALFERTDLLSSGLIDQVDYANSLTNHAAILMEIGKYSKEAGLSHQAERFFVRSLRLHRQAISLLPDLNPVTQSVSRPKFYNNLGLLFGSWGQLDSASHYHQLALELRLPSENDGSDFDNLGQVRLAQGRYAEAIELIGKSLPLYRQAYGSMLYEAKPLTQIGLAYARQGKHEQALDSYQRALRTISWQAPGDTSTSEMPLDSWWANPPVSEVVSPVLFLEVLYHKSRSLLAIADRGNKAELLRLLPTYQLAFEVMEDLKKKVFNDQLAFMLAGMGQKVTEEFLSLNRQLILLSMEPERSGDNGRQMLELIAGSAPTVYPPEMQIRFDEIYSLEGLYQAMERNRANRLLQGLKLVHTDPRSQISREVRAAELQINGQLREVRELVFEATKNPSMATAFEPNAAQLEQLQARKDSLLAVIQEQNPDYYALRYDTRAADLASMQQALDKDQILLEYFWGTNHLYTFKIRQDSVHLYIQPADSIDGWIRQLLPTISSKEAYLTEGFAQTGLQPARKLYQSLLGSVLTPEERETSRLVLVRDSSLTQLPFQVLLASDPAPGQRIRLQDLDFAVNHHSFSYQYSAKLFAFQKDLPPSQGKGILAMAPFPPRGEDGPYQEGTNTILALSYSETELAAIPGKKKPWIGTDASRENFLAAASEYAILHFSSHAEANSAFPDSSFLRFSLASEGGSKMWAKEVAELELRAESVVLSACETSVGPYIGGEGLLSLARAFTLAGAKHVLATQWPLVDETGAAIIGFYYEELAKGHPKDVALQQAQLRYLAAYTQLSDQRAHPYLWSALISIGSDTPVDRYF